MSTPDSEQKIEQEWQLEVADPVRLEASLLSASRVDSEFSIRPLGEFSVNDRYMDTLDGMIMRSGWKFRIRESGGEFEATFKSWLSGETTSGLLKNRREITQDLEVPDVHGLFNSESQAGRLLASLCRPSRLRVLFLVRTVRRRFHLSRPQGGLAELSLDRMVYYDAEGRLLNDSVPCQLEIEMLEGNSDLFKTAVQALVLREGLCPVSESKFERGLRLARIQWDYPPDIGPPRISKEQVISQFAYGVLRIHFLRLLNLEPGTRLGEHEEYLHQMRVASRRLRSALKLFEPYLPPMAQAFRRNQLKWIGDTMGRVRDLDVKIAQRNSWVQGYPGDLNALHKVIELNKEEWKRARITLLKAFDSKRYADFKTRFAAFLKAERIPNRRAATRPVLEALPGLIEGCYKKVSKNAEKAKNGGVPQEYHRLRLDCKRLRYTLEFAKDFYNGKDLALRKRVIQVQEVLGQYNDAVVGCSEIQELIRRYQDKLSVPVAFALGQIAERYQAESARRKAEFPAIYDKVQGKPWKKFRKTMLFNRKGAKHK